MFITENEINFLAFPAVADSLIIFGAGYGFETLVEAAWLARCRIHYWGDIDKSRRADARSIPHGITQHMQRLPEPGSYFPADITIPPMRSRGRWIACAASETEGDGEVWGFP